MNRRDLIHNALALSVASLAPGAAMAASGDGIKSLDQHWPVRGTESYKFSSKAVLFSHASTVDDFNHGLLANLASALWA